MTTLADIKRHQRDPRPDPTQLVIDRDWLVGQVEELTLQIRDLRRALLDVEVLAQEAETAAYQTVSLARMARTNDPVPASPQGGERR